MESNWLEYKDWVAGNNDYYYRGQYYSGWKLQTSFHRYTSQRKITLKYYLESILPEVKKHISKINNEEIDISNEEQLLSFLTKLQHHGFPTPLLDWTLSPFIAAYFAFRNVGVGETEYVSIYAFDSKKWSDISQHNSSLNYENNFLSVYKPQAEENSRIIKQEAVITATNISDLSEYILKYEEALGEKILYHFQFPISEKSLVMKELEKKNINSVTMFPDFDGICKAMKEQFFTDQSM